MNDISALEQCAAVRALCAVKIENVIVACIVDKPFHAVTRFETRLFDVYAIVKFTQCRSLIVDNKLFCTIPIIPFDLRIMMLALQVF